MRELLENRFERLLVVYLGSIVFVDLKFEVFWGRYRYSEFKDIGDFC